MTLTVKRNDMRILEFIRTLPLIEPPDTEPLWDEQKNTLLIDSILNNIPIGTIFLMRHPRQIIGPGGWAYEYKILDGYERLTAITAFKNGNLPLPDDFRFFESEFVQAGGMTRKDLKETYPMLSTRFMEHQLDIQVVEASSKLEITRMFKRLDIHGYCFGRE